MSTGSEYQLDIGSFKNVNSLKYIKVAHQSPTAAGFANKVFNVSVSILLMLENTLKKLMR